MSITRIAEAANVSYATAWRIINNRPCSSQEAVAAVRRAMGQLGYTPNTNTNGARRGRRAKIADGIRTHNIALLHLRPGSSISTTVLNRVQRMLAERNLNLIFAHTDGTDALPQAVRTGNVDGILGYGQFPPEAVTPRLRDIPAVWMMSRADDELDPWGDRVKPDHQGIGQLAADFLLGRGHRCLAYMNPDVDMPVYQQRLIAFQVAGAARGIALRAYRNTSGDDIEDAAERQIDEWLATSPRPTGLFVPVDRVTMRVYRHLERRGIQPGREVEIVSCDNERELLTLMHPAPASVDLNRQTIARLAVERLLWRMKNGMSSPRVVVTVTPTLAEATSVVS
jgi:DNA-binding LacI/PurR family transcriptional regulator